MFQVSTIVELRDYPGPANWTAESRTLWENFRKIRGGDRLNLADWHLVFVDTAIPGRVPDVHGSRGSPTLKLPGSVNRRCWLGIRRTREMRAQYWYCSPAAGKTPALRPHCGGGGSRRQERRHDFRARMPDGRWPSP